MNELDMRDPNKAYIADARPEFGGAFEFWVYALEEIGLPEDELGANLKAVLEWCLNNCQNEWRYVEIGGPHIQQPLSQTTVDSNFNTLSLTEKLEWTGYGAYAKHLKIIFTNAEDAVHFKLVFG
jgi:hypothetical protein